ncbi:pyridoxal phosphate-dependent decarboxylase family protein [Actinomycetospora cinnamomea]|uniref:Glutamate/tyrosine decarboxylase-like PLP-dependent enzyme n=1 Tax=Actinomycetospora cinnamomea TaxID=663609 RepID=A0A2U1EU23_9PSEU|nr:pyridoxal-dependent decarboxylase [Actinomycetospora cinnamomea]PVZ03434.1 glutamate/tyrosine decarboxylase-like PLP-dependent enzyme [Actinomycetospora cinnamomea]
MWDEALDRARRFADGWLASLPERPVGVPVADAEMRARLDDRLPEEGRPAARVLDELASALEPGLVASGGPRYFGFVTGGALPVALGADWMVAAADQNAAARVMSPAAAAVEEVTGGWVLDLLGLPAEAAVGFVTGAQMANVSCLAAARHALLAAEGWDVEGDGLAGAPVPTVVVGEAVHSTVLRALRLLGLGSGRAVRVGADDQGRMRPERLREALAAIDGPVLVCAQAGQVDTGAGDPFDAVADLVAARPRAWLHVDGAFGLWAAAAPARRHLVAGVERADSWAVDAHKWLNVPYDCAMAIVRDPEALVAAHSTTAAYLTLGGSDPSGRTPESSRRARALPVHAALRHLGRQGVADLVERCCTLARQAADELARHPGIEVLNEVVLNQVLFAPRGVDPGELSQAIARDGTCWVGTSAWHGRPALRLSVSNWSTTPADVTRSTAAITALVDRLA